MSCFSLDGRWLVGGNQAGCVLWDVTTWEPVRSQPKKGRSHGAVSFAPDGKTIAMPHDRLHSGPVGRAPLNTLIVLDTDERPFAAAATFSPYGTRLALSSHEDFEVWGLLDFRRSLGAMDLDWSSPLALPAEVSLPPQLRDAGGVELNCGD